MQALAVASPAFDLSPLSYCCRCPFCAPFFLVLTLAVWGMSASLERLVGMRSVLQSSSFWCEKLAAPGHSTRDTASETEVACLLFVCVCVMDPASCKATLSHEEERYEANSRWWHRRHPGICHGRAGSLRGERKPTRPPYQSKEPLVRSIRFTPRDLPVTYFFFLSGLGR